MTTSAPAALPDRAPHETIGYIFPVWRTAIGRERQARYHAALGIDGAPYRRSADVSLLGNDCLHGARPVDNLGRKRLHFGVRLRQTAPVPLDVPLEVRATVKALERVKRGELISIDFAFALPSGEVPVRIDHVSLMLDDGPPKPAGGGRAAEMPEAGFEVVRRVPLDLAAVSGFSFEFPHLEAHHSAEAAARIGLRAPIAQGLMSFTLMSNALAREAPPGRLDIEARFVRPVFCDETLTVEARREDGRIAALRCVKPDGRTASTALVHGLGY